MYTIHNTSRTEKRQERHPSLRKQNSANKQNHWNIYFCSSVPCRQPWRTLNNASSSVLQPFFHVETITLTRSPNKERLESTLCFHAVKPNEKPPNMGSHNQTKHSSQRCSPTHIHSSAKQMHTAMMKCLFFTVPENEGKISRNASSHVMLFIV